MPKLKHSSLFLFLFLLASFKAFAQPSNDVCANAITITNVLDWCSAPGAFNNNGATNIGYDPAGCFSGQGNDVWFKFVAQATDVAITINGATPNLPGGTLQDPEIAIYFGSCGGSISELNCDASNAAENNAQIIESGLFVGSTYLVRIQGADNQEGTFQFCINNYNPPVLPTADCPQASILCDKSSFVVQQFSGAGANIKELDDATCFNNGSAGNNNESNSTWYVWKCETSGSLTFVLTPLKTDDDLDFVVYRLPNGIGNCTNKEVVRCNAAGESQNALPSPCMGPTGLQDGDPDASENAGCSDPGDDAWISPFNMIAGETYALCVNNYTSSGKGFSISFGGSGTFVGPDANFTTVPTAVCLGIPVQIIDNSTFSVGAITSKKWSFGSDATPQTANGNGPFTVTFTEPGQHPVVLTLETDLGCKLTEIKNITIFPPVEIDSVVAEPDCNGGTNGTVGITNIKNGTPPYQFSWNNGPFSSTSTLSNIGVGVYNLVIVDANNCKTNISIPVDELKLTVDPDVTPPLCFGDDNGTISLNVTNGAAPYQFDWGNGFINSNVQGNFVAGVYTILGLDAALCKGTFNVTVTDNLPLALTVDTIDITCFSANDGMSTATVTGGVGNYRYLWSNGDNTAKITDLGPGQYSVTVTDGNECSITGAVFITEPADVSVALIDVVDLICNGLPEGEIRVQGFGGVEPYMFSADGTNFVMTDTLIGLLAGDYFVKIKDAEGCIDSVAATIIQPPALTVLASPQDTTIDLGFELQINTLTTPFGRPVAFLWTPPLGLSCVNCAEPSVIATTSQFYLVQITDSTGCVAYDSIRLNVEVIRPIYAPNVFAPANPYPNDHFTLFGGPAAAVIDLMRIYDRWGELVFEKENFELNQPNVGWDGIFRGKPAESGVYTYYAYVKFIDETVLKFKGSVTIVR
jgi:CHU_C Type IX secretion signal domain/SprB repeat